MFRLCGNRLGLVCAVLIFTLAPHSPRKYFNGAEIITKERYKYGAVEARIRAAQGSGLITAFFYWKYDSELPDTQWQEQDFEIFGQTGHFQSQVMTPGEPRTQNKGAHTLPSRAWQHYYTYRMEWTPSYLAFYVDGHLVRMETDPVRFAKHLDPQKAEPAEIRLSLWAGNNAWAGSFNRRVLPAATFVDYVAVYQYDAASDEFVLDWRDDFDSLDNARWWFADWTFSSAVNDYVPSNAVVKDGKLILSLTNKFGGDRASFMPPPDNPKIAREGDFIPSKNTPTPTRKKTTVVVDATE